MGLLICRKICFCFSPAFSGFEAITSEILSRCSWLKDDAVVNFLEKTRLGSVLEKQKFKRQIRKCCFDNAHAALLSKLERFFDHDA